MKKVKLFTSVLALTLALTASVKAIELVEIEELNNNVASVNVVNDIELSLKNIPTLTLNIEKSAEGILVAQNEKQFNANDLNPTLVAVAE